MGLSKPNWLRVVFYNLLIFACFAALMEIAASVILAVHESMLREQALQIADLATDSNDASPNVQSYSDPAVRRDLDAAKSAKGGSYRYEPFIVYLPQPFASEYVNITDEGFRQNRRLENYDNIPDFKIWMFGSSALYGVSNADHETIPAYLESLLTERHPTLRFQVRNFGVVGYLSLQDYLHLKIRLLDDTPDLVIAFNGVNDHYAAYLNNSPKRAANHINVLPREVLRYYVQMHQDEGLFNWAMIKRTIEYIFSNSISLIKKSFKFFALRSANANIDEWKESYARLKAEEFSRSSNVVPTMRDFYIDNMRQFIDLARHYGARVVVAHQPLLFATTKPLVGNERMENTHPRLSFFSLDDSSIEEMSEIPSYRLTQTAYWSMDDFLSSYFQQAEALSELAASEKVSYVDAQSIVDEAGSVAIFTSPYHFTFRGARLIAEGILPAVERELEIGQ